MLMTLYYISKQYGGYIIDINFNIRKTGNGDRSNDCVTFNVFYIFIDLLLVKWPLMLNDY